MVKESYIKLLCGLHNTIKTEFYHKGYNMVVKYKRVKNNSKDYIILKNGGFRIVEVYKNYTIFRIYKRI